MKAIFQTATKLISMDNFLDDDVRKALAITQKLTAFIVGKETFFGATQKRFRHYWEMLQSSRDKRLTQEVNHYSGEILSRFMQLDFLLDKVRQLEKEAEVRRQTNIGKKPLHLQWIDDIKESGDATAVPLTEEIVDSMIDSFQQDQTQEIELYTEAFYYFAQRLMKAIQYYPGLNNFVAPGVVIVRNHLIKHPYGKDGVSASSICYDGSEGPLIKPGSYVGQKRKSFDAGLYKNADEFRSNLEDELRNALGALQRESS